MPEISAAFKVEDIHRIRVWQYEMRKGMTPQEISADTRKGAKIFLELLEAPVDPAIQAVIDQRMQSVENK
jgi:hypothetical protein